jgi:hypothetical protein
MWRAGTALVLIAGLVGLVAGRYQLLSGTVTGSAADHLRVAPCLPGEAVEIMHSPHIAPTEWHRVRYNSQPPTSGPHFSFTVATGVYAAPVPAGLSVHAMEHGHILIQYAPDSPDREVATLTTVARRYGARTILAPQPELAHGIALTAWGRLELLDTVDERRIAEFVDRLAGRYDHGWTGDDPC